VAKIFKFPAVSYFDNIPPLIWTARVKFVLILYDKAEHAPRPRGPVAERAAEVGANGGVTITTLAK